MDVFQSLKQENGTVLSEVEKFTEMSPSASSDAPLVNGEEFSTSATTIESSVDGEVVISSEREVVRRLTSKISEQTTGSVAVIADIEGSLQFAFQQLHKTQDAISAMDKVWLSESLFLVFVVELDTFNACFHLFLTFHVVTFCCSACICNIVCLLYHFA